MCLLFRGDHKEGVQCIELSKLICSSRVAGCHGDGCHFIVESRAVCLPALSRVLSFVNIHLFHDEDNFISLNKVSRELQ